MVKCNSVPPLALLLHPHLKYQLSNFCSYILRRILQHQCSLFVSFLWQQIEFQQLVVRKNTSRKTFFFIYTITLSIAWQFLRAFQPNNVSRHKFKLNPLLMEHWLNQRDSHWRKRRRSLAIQPAHKHDKKLYRQVFTVAGDTFTF